MADLAHRILPVSFTALGLRRGGKTKKRSAPT